MDAPPDLTELDGWVESVSQTRARLRTAIAATDQANATTALKFVKAANTIDTIQRRARRIKTAKRRTTASSAWQALVDIECEINEASLEAEQELRRIRNSFGRAAWFDEFLRGRASALASELLELRILHEALLETMLEVQRRTG